LRSLLKPGEQVALWGISVDTPEQSRGFVEKIVAEAGGAKLTFPLLSDPQHRAIDAYGLSDPRYLQQRREGIPYPTVYLVDKAGRVAWARIDKDFRQRPSHSEIRTALDALK
jgi:peroxiredoxin